MVHSRVSFPRQSIQGRAGWDSRPVPIPKENIQPQTLGPAIPAPRPDPASWRRIGPFALALPDFVDRLDKYDAVVKDYNATAPENHEFEANTLAFLNSMAL
ncbi:hypothetical protein CHS0354_038224 [Potamilus streckersoni]|uniref:Uncharacterized protein n=1 Tax=Potamilus streckersoni TaxID=2493646 RepID=A0AAE0T129_9BIVA|nr:hypothetical protein CHS0354_038224 [Potamilus streckersoni]